MGHSFATSKVRPAKASVRSPGNAPNTSVLPFQGLAQTPVELLQRAIACLNTGDTVGLYRLSVTREEYLQIYRYLPRADTTNSDDRDFRMGFFLMDNRKMLLREFENFGRKPGQKQLEFSRFAYAGEREELGKLAFQHGLKVWVKRDAAEFELPISKSLIAINGGWKLWGFTSD